MAHAKLSYPRMLLPCFATVLYLPERSILSIVGLEEDIGGQMKASA